SFPALWRSTTRVRRCQQRGMSYWGPELLGRLLAGGGADSDGSLLLEELGTVSDHDVSVDVLNLIRIGVAALGRDLLSRQQEFGGAVRALHDVVVLRARIQIDVGVSIGRSFVRL